MSGDICWYNYDSEDLAALAGRDSVLGEAIDRIGPVRRRIYPDPFTGLMRAIIGQQISSKAQAAIWERFKNAFSPADPEKIARLEPEEIRRTGVSLPKARYLKGVASAFANGLLTESKMACMNDRELANLLSGLPGVGKWTVEMLLIFTFQRKDVLSYSDLGIRRGMMRLYGYQKLDAETFERHRKCYSPYSTLAGMYLWEIAGGALKPVTENQ